MGLLLTNNELVELTGYKLPSKQVSWLQSHGYYVEINARGLPRITYLQIEEMRRVNTPINLTSRNKVPAVNHPITQGKNLNDQQFSASEPNMNNLLNKIKVVNKVSTHG